MQYVCQIVPKRVVDSSGINDLLANDKWFCCRSLGLDLSYCTLPQKCLSLLYQNAKLIALRCSNIGETNK